MLDSGKVRIYDLARNLVSEDLPEKEKKDQQANKTKQIVTLCEKLGFGKKTPSSSLETNMVSRILLFINNETSIDNIQAGSNPASPATNKKTRVLRRIDPTIPVVEEPEIFEPEEAEAPEEIIEEIPEEIPEEAPPPPPVVIAPVVPVIAKIEVPSVVEQVIEQTIEQVLPPKVEVKPLPPKPSMLLANQPKVNPKAVEVKQPVLSEAAKVAGPAKPISRPMGPASDALRNQNQPFRVARPLSLPFSTRPKKAAPSRRPAGGRGGPGKSDSKGRGKAAAIEGPSEIFVQGQITVKELALALRVQETEVIRSLFMKGTMRTVNQTLDLDLVIQVAAEFDCTVNSEQSPEDSNTDLSVKLKDLVSQHTSLDSKDSPLEKRAPVVTIMGHVDHGKTSLLDAIRKVKKKITDGESGGITQHIGAYQVKVIDYDDQERIITFLDTPGHEAFTALRARGAQITDLAILVVAADDGVMPQTIEAIAHAKAAEIPIIVAVNKIDKPGANPEKVLLQLMEYGIVVEDYGGPVAVSKISAKQQLNLEDLLTKVTLVADAELGNKLLASPNSKAVGAVIEASLSSSRGPVASFLVQSGTLRKGDAVAAGSSYGRIRAMFDDNGLEIMLAPPSTPVQVLGMDILPQAGDTFQAFKNYGEAKASAELAKDNSKRKRIAGSLEFLSTQIREGVSKELAVVIKADTQGSAEAIAQELNKLSNAEVSLRIVHCAAGTVNESDVNLAVTTGASLVCFRASIDSTATRLLQEQEMSVYNFDVIYHLTEAIQKAMHGLLEPEVFEVKHGAAQVLKIFAIGKNRIAGCLVNEGKLVTNAEARIFREKKEIHRAPLKGLKRFKDDVKEVLQGFECGISVEGFTDFAEGDLIEAWGKEYRVRGQNG